MRGRLALHDVHLQNLLDDVGEVDLRGFDSAPLSSTVPPRCVSSSANAAATRLPHSLPGTMATPLSLPSAATRRATMRASSSGEQRKLIEIARRAGRVAEKIQGKHRRAPGAHRQQRRRRLPW